MSNLSLLASMRVTSEANQSIRRKYKAQSYMSLTGENNLTHHLNPPSLRESRWNTRNRRKKDMYHKKGMQLKTASSKK